MTQIIEWFEKANALNFCLGLILAATFLRFIYEIIMDITIDKMKDLTKEQAEKYQELFNLMSKEHGLTLTVDEMDEIIRVSQKTVKLIDNTACTHENTVLKMVRCCLCEDCGEFVELDV